MIRVPLPGGGVAELREPTPVDLEVHGWGNDGDIALACIRTIDGEPVKPDDVTAQEQQAALVAVQSFIRPSLAQAEFMEANWREATRRSAWLALPSGMTYDAEGKVADCTLWLEIGHPKVSEMNDAMERVSGRSERERVKSYQQALHRLALRCFRSVREGDKTRTLTMNDVSPWRWTAMDLSVALYAFATVCQLTDGQKAAVAAGVEVVA